MHGNPLNQVKPEASHLKYGSAVGVPEAILADHILKDITNMAKSPILGPSKGSEKI